METLDLSLALEMLDGEKDLLMELLKAFVSGARLDGAELERLEALPDRTEAAKYVHFYKGAARQLAAQKLAASGQALEDVLRGKKSGDIVGLNIAQDGLGCYWTSASEDYYYEQARLYAKALRFGKECPPGVRTGGRCDGFSIRPVSD